MAKLPAYLKVNGRDFQIKYRAPSRMPDVLGLCHTDDGLIEIRKGQEQHTLQDTLLHEAMHAILASQGRENGGDEEELYVRALATGLLGVFKDNPWFSDWLTNQQTP